MYSFSQEEITQIESRGSTILQVTKQIEVFEQGFQHTALAKAATIGDGIIQLSSHEVDELIEKFDTQKRYHSIVKFVPASGAASRMFKHLFEYLKNQTETSDIVAFMKKIHSFGFTDELNKALDGKLEQLLSKKKYQIILEALLHESKLNFGQLPKGLIPFHVAKNEIRTAFQEHFAEGVKYASNGENNINIHFTITEEHQEKFDYHLKEFITAFEEKSDAKFEISYSYQKKSTDTIAVDTSNIPVNKTSGEFLFRPGGHGALIQNLNEIDADIIFIKNIDNVLPDNHKTDTIKYKKVLAAKLIDLQAHVFHYIEKLNIGNELLLLKEVEGFINEQMSMNLGDDFSDESLKEKQETLLRILNRPLRVCGMVKNTGETGGGPFWIKNLDGTTSLQIVEAAQIDLNDNTQEQIMKSSTHFNPVDLVCATKNYQGESFDLTQYIDTNSYFISEKSFQGKTIKVLEHPGLWNGAMADWNTVFVEVPISTFSPVKSVNDLLKEEHRWQ